MKTPMQGLLEWVRATLPMDLDTSRMIEQKIESLLEDERDLILDTYDECILLWDQMTAEEYYESTFINQKGE